MDGDELTSIPRRTTTTPDPSDLTTAALMREVSALRELFEARLAGEARARDQRFDGMDRAIDIHAKSLDQNNAYVKHEIEQLQALHQEKFRSIESSIVTKFEAVANQFIAFDKLREQLSLAAGTAVAAALQAQKESAGATQDANAVALTKMENSFTKQIDQVTGSLTIMGSNTDEKINDLKGRLDRGEGRTSVSDPAVSNGIAQLTQLVQNLSKTHDTAAGQGAGQAQTWGVAAAVVGIGIAALTMMFKIPSSPSPDANATAISRLEYMFEQHLKQNDSRAMTLPAPLTR
jgi:hypothetical protein